ncbi:MAG: hypothetical protein O2856_06510 [Planctomycetota bacterium]|nr:hypothetical protein [Planctomycetota bacterium]
MLRSVTSLAAVFALASTALAHEGHGHAAHQHGAIHYVVNPSHAVSIVLFVAAIVALGWRVSRSVRKSHST